MSEHQRILRPVALTLVLGGVAACSEPVRVERSWPVMGTQARVEVYAQTERGAEEAIERIRSAFANVDASMSNWRPDSELSRLNREAAAGPFYVRDAELYRCIKIALAYAKTTRGAFDPTVGPLMRLYGFRPREPRVPDAAAIDEALRTVGWNKVEMIDVAKAVRFREPAVELDLGGIAKGYALDVGARVFARVGCKAGLLDLGGNLYAWNHPPGLEAWRVGIRDPFDSRAVMAVVELANRAVSTSANLENAFTRDGMSYGHIMSADSGRPARSDLIAATVIADSGADADALSTAFYVAGSKRSGRLLERSRRVEAILLVQGRDGPYLLASASLKGRLTLDPRFAERVGGEPRYLLPPQALLGSGLDDVNPWEHLID